jgi:hypothetical protein
MEEGTLDSWYDWDKDLYPIHGLPKYARNRVMRYLRDKSVLKHTAPDICSAAAEAYRQCLASWDHRRDLETYVKTSMVKRMNGRLDELQIGAQTSRNAAAPNFTYAGVGGSAMSHTGYGGHGYIDYEQMAPGEGLSDKAYRDLKAAVRNFKRGLKTPSEQQDGYLSKMHFKAAMYDLLAFDPFVHEVVFWVIVQDKSISEAVKELKARWATRLETRPEARRAILARDVVKDALEYGKSFVWSRLSLEDPDSVLGSLRQETRKIGVEPVWRGLDLSFPIEVREDEEDDEGWVQLVRQEEMA